VLYISYLSFLSKLAECVVKNRLTQHLSSNNLLNKYQSAYAEHYSTESTLLPVPDRIIKAVSQQQVSASYLLDLSAAFHTIDNSILLHCLSTWFDLIGKVISSSHHNCHHVGSWSLSTQVLLLSLLSVLSPLVFILYTTPLSSLISDSSVGQHMYADDNKLFISFVTSEFSTKRLHS